MKCPSTIGTWTRFCLFSLETIKFSRLTKYSIILSIIFGENWSLLIVFQDLRNELVKAFHLGLNCYECVLIGSFLSCNVTTRLLQMFRFTQEYICQDILIFPQSTDVLPLLSLLLVCFSYISVLFYLFIRYADGILISLIWRTRLEMYLSFLSVRTSEAFTLLRRLCVIQADIVWWVSW